MSSPSNNLDKTENPNSRLKSPPAKKERPSEPARAVENKPADVHSPSEHRSEDNQVPKSDSKEEDKEVKVDKVEKVDKKDKDHDNKDEEEQDKPKNQEDSPAPSHKDKEDKKDKKDRPDPKKPGGIVDMDTFGQILEMDEDENDRDFSHGIVVNFYEQAHVTFGELDEALKAKDLHTLHTKGHFLKGSSAALGLIKVKASCEAIQVYGRLQDPKTHKEISEEIALQQAEKALSNAKDEYDEAEGWLKAFYDEQD